MTRVWVRNHHDHDQDRGRGGGWIPVPWVHLRSTPVPFGQQAWDHARRMLARRGEDPVTEQAIAAAAAALLDKAEHGPDRTRLTAQDRRVAGRTRAATPAARAAITPDAPVERPASTPTAPAVLDPAVGRAKLDVPVDGLAGVDADSLDPFPARQVPAPPDLLQQPDLHGQDNDPPRGPGLAKVIPLKVFDLFEEAQRRW